jgi:hypothetical protein
METVDSDCPINCVEFTLRNFSLKREFRVATVVTPVAMSHH